MPSLERWRTTWKGLGVERPDDRLFGEVVERYSERHRKYHTTEHLDECFARLDEARTEAERVHEVEVALWFHDAVYESAKNDNEARSASWAKTVVSGCGLPGLVADRVHALIMATKHDVEPATRDARLLVDVDLWILAAPVERFDEYERQVRQEYAWVPDFLFRRKRREILGAFSARPHVFHTAHFRSHYEARARANLERSIRVLGG